MVTSEHGFLLLMLLEINNTVILILLISLLLFQEENAKKIFFRLDDIKYKSDIIIVCLPFFYDTNGPFGLRGKEGE